MGHIHFQGGFIMNVSKVSYESTRSPLIRKSGKEAVLKGISPDGGLFVRADLGQEKVDLNQICHQSYLENAQSVLSLLLDDYSESELADCIQNAYSTTFSNEAITPVVHPDQDSSLYVLELFHGPTSAFKDVALTLLPQLMSRALPEGEKAMILTATSGDTGKAALSGFQDVDNIGISVFYPHNKVSQIQYRQMACQKGSNTAVFAVEGNFDDAQSQVKKLFLDEELNDMLKEEGIRLSSANSINVGRLVPQVVYYFDAYKQLVNQNVIQPGEEVSFSVPTGNFGDVLAGYYAKKLGLPVKKFYVASNANNVLTDFLNTGVYDRNRQFVQTISPSMDILISSNLERLLYYMSDQDHEQVAAWMKDLAEKGSYDVGPAMKEKIQKEFAAGCYDDEQTRKLIAEIYEKTGYVLDPHSAIGYALASDAAAADPNAGVIVCLATASPYKFSMHVMEAIDGKRYGEWEALHALEKINPQPVPAALAELEEAEILHKAVIAVEDMKEAVKKTSLEKLG